MMLKMMITMKICKNFLKKKFFQGALLEELISVSIKRQYKKIKLK